MAAGEVDNTFGWQWGSLIPGEGEAYSEHTLEAHRCDRRGAFDDQCPEVR